MLVKLDERYDSKATASRIWKMSELVSLRYVSLKENIGIHIDKIEALIEQLKNIRTTIEDVLAVGIHVASIDVQQFLQVTAAIKTLSEDKVT